MSTLNSLNNTGIPCLHSFQEDVSLIELPKTFTFPFCYEPHQLSAIATDELQRYLTEQRSWFHDFGLAHHEVENEKSSNKASGKMFGVLVVKSANGELGYLAAFSGKLADKTQLFPFVPPVSDPFDEESDYHSGQLVVNQLNQKILTLQGNNLIQDLTQKLKEKSAQLKVDEDKLREEHRQNRAKRKSVRKNLPETLTESDKNELIAALARESILDKKAMLAHKDASKKALEAIETSLKLLTDEITQLKNERSNLSIKLQRGIFEQYKFLNIAKQTQNLLDLFLPTVNKFPPAGAGDCAAPKLLQYAFINDLTPIAMAEFWWGKSPKSEIRQHKNFYPSCSGKCKPILKHMLDGIELDDNPLLIKAGKTEDIEILYQDDAMVIINKPPELLSVPGVEIKDSVYTRMKALFPDATGSLIVHRLDMSTSGLMVIALTTRAHKQLQKQFIQRTIQKRYIARITQKPAASSGNIFLPLRGDLNDRPRQLVCEEYGKTAETFWELIEKDNELDNGVLIHLYPKTGRTHQLRVHCAHPLGLNAAIVGDDLYGKKTTRLHLHADELRLSHPYTRKMMTFNRPSDFE